LAQSTGESKKTEDKGSMLILLGTQGGPGVTLTRSQTANVLVVGIDSISSTADAARSAPWRKQGWASTIS
jgi:hypothetical protein